MNSMLTRLSRITAALVATLLVAAGLTATTPAFAAPVTTVTPTISGTAQVGEVLTADPGSWTPAETTFSYQWKRGVTNVGTDSATYTVTADDIGSTITVTVTGSADGYESDSATSAETAAVIAGVFTSTPIPTISGTAQVGQVLTASAGTWAPAGATFSYQWTRGVTDVGTDSATYTVAAGDIGSTITVTVTGSIDGYDSDGATSAATSTVIAGVFTSAPTPTISGTTKVGHTLTAAGGTWLPTPTSLTYQWLRNGSTISGATASTYVLTTSDLGATVSVTTTATKTGFTTQSKTSSSTSAIVAGEFTVSPNPTLTGRFEVGRTLSVSLGSWTPTPTTVTYRWFRDGIRIVGATSSTFELLPRDRGHEISVRIVASSSGIPSVVRRSVRTEISRGVFDTTPTPTVAGTTEVGDTLTATIGSWSDSATLTYQWKRGGTAIEGATGTTYVIQPADFGSTITISVTGSRRGFSSTTTTSSATGAVTAADLTSTAVPTITSPDTFRVGQRLTAVPGAWGPGTISFTYQWLRDGVDIAGATASTYVPTASDLGTALSVEVTGSRFGYVSETTTSLETTDIVIGTFSPAPTPVISGTVRVGKTLTATVGTWDTGATTLAYQWKRDGVNISGATALTYTLTADDLDTDISFTATASASGYTSASRTSLTTNPVVVGVFPSTPRPILVGTGRVGTTFSVTTGNWGSTPDDFDYQWFKNGVAVVGATSSTFALTASHLSASISVDVTANRAGFTSVTRSSADTVVLSGLFTNSAASVITGILSVGQTLSASTGTWSPTPDSYSYQWRRNGVAIVGANQSTYSVNSTDVGKQISVTVTAKSNGYANKRVTSAAVTIE